MRYELVIGTKNWSSWSLRAWLALKMADVPFTEQLIALRRSDSKRVVEGLSPSARVPILRIIEREDLAIVFDSLAICETIAERFPEAGLWPDDPNVRSLARSYASEMHSGFLTLREALPMDFARQLPVPTLDQEVEGQIKRIQQAWQDALTNHGKDGGFLFGRFSIADCFYAPVVSRFWTYSIELSNQAQAYAERIMALPAMQEWGVGARQEIEDGLPDQWVVEMERNAR